MTAILAFLATAYSLATSAVKQVTAIVPWYYIAIGGAFLFGFTRGCNYERPHKSAMHAEARACDCGPNCKCAGKNGGDCLCAKDEAVGFDAAFREAKAADKPLVIFVGCTQRSVPGCICCSVQAGGDWHKTPAIAVGLPVTGAELVTLPIIADDDSIVSASRKLKAPAVPVASAPVQFLSSGCPGGVCGRR